MGGWIWSYVAFQTWARKKHMTFEEHYAITVKKTESILDYMRTRIDQISEEHGSQIAIGVAANVGTELIAIVLASTGEESLLQALNQITLVKSKGHIVSTTASEAIEKAKKSWTLPKDGASVANRKTQMIYLKQKTLGGNIVVARFDNDEMFKATYSLVQIRKRSPNLKHTYFLVKERGGK